LNFQPGFAREFFDNDFLSASGFLHFYTCIDVPERAGVVMNQGKSDMAVVSVLELSPLLVRRVACQV
jgi:hypothetical protein